MSYIITLIALACVTAYMGRLSARVGFEPMGIVILIIGYLAVVGEIWFAFSFPVSFFLFNFGPVATIVGVTIALLVGFLLGYITYKPAPTTPTLRS